MIITVRVEDNIAYLFKLYAKEKNTTLSALLRDTLTERIEKDYRLLEKEAGKEAQRKEKAL